MLDGGRGQTIQGEPNMLAFGGTGCDTGNGLVVNNHTVIDCERHRVVFPESEGICMGQVHVP